MVPSNDRTQLLAVDERTLFIDERCDRYEAEWRASQRAADRRTTWATWRGRPRLALWLELVMLDQELRRGTGRVADPGRLPGELPRPHGLAGPVHRRAGPDREAPAAAAGDGRPGRSPSPATIGAEWTLDRAEPIADPEASTAASSAEATDPAGLPSTAGPPPEGDAAGHRRPGDRAPGRLLRRLRAARAAGLRRHGRRLRGPAEAAQPHRSRSR